MGPVSKGRHRLLYYHSQTSLEVIDNYKTAALRMIHQTSGLQKVLYCSRWSAQTCKLFLFQINPTNSESELLACFCPAARANVPTTNTAAGKIANIDQPPNMVFDIDDNILDLCDNVNYLSGIRTPRKRCNLTFLKQGQLLLTNRMSIATFIKQDLIANIRSGEIGADRLTLDALSKRYQVSATPVRAAVRELIEEKYLKKRDNGRLAIRFESLAGAASAPQEPTDWAQVIANDLVQLSLDGEPVLLREETTAGKYGISRSSIRQIFHRLAGRGILRHLPRRGWQLRPFRQADLDDYIDVRITLELKALELAWPRLVDEDLHAMLDANRLPLARADQPMSDNALHAYLIEKSHNTYIADFFDRHAKYYDALFEWENLDRDAQVQEVRHHREILEALLRRDRPAAERALVNHIRNNHPVLLNKRPEPVTSRCHQQTSAPTGKSLIH
jgi:DNA-binding GntR family transcriptional regulator